TFMDYGELMTLREKELPKKGESSLLKEKTAVKKPHLPDLSPSFWIESLFLSGNCCCFAQLPASRLSGCTGLSMGGCL
ncbi:MAG: hypothetical protein WD490_11060, partial [Opitutales bacterium]